MRRYHLSLLGPRNRVDYGRCAIICETAARALAGPQIFAAAQQAGARLIDADSVKTPRFDNWRPGGGAPAAAAARATVAQFAPALLGPVASAAPASGLPAPPTAVAAPPTVAPPQPAPVGFSRPIPQAVYDRRRPTDSDPNAAPPRGLPANMIPGWSAEVALRDKMHRRRLKKPPVRP